MSRPLAIVAVLLLLAGCDARSPFRRMPAAPPGAVSWQTTPRAAEPMRVAVLPFAVADGLGRSAGDLAPALADSLRALGRHEVVLVRPEQAARLAIPDLRTGSVPVDTLLAVRDATRCDAVVIGRIESFDGFHPIAIGCAAHLVSCQDGAVLWSVQAQLDGKRDDIQRDVEGWWNRTTGDQAVAVSGWKSVLTSPREFSRYAADRLAWTVEQEPE